MASEPSRTEEQGVVQRIMIVDDSRLMRRSVVKILRGLYNIVEAGDGEEAWKMLCEDKEIRIVCCDLSMPVLDGFGFLKRVRLSDEERIKEMPVIIVTGNEDTEENRNEVLEKGATDFVSKPFDSAQLKARIKTHIKLEKTTRDLEKKSTELVEKAAVDPVTGLGTRAYFDKSGRQMISYSRRHEHELVVLQLAIDNFQDLFIKVGKPGASALLRKVGEILSRHTRQEDALSRISVGGFAALLRTASLEGATKMAERVRTTIDNVKITVAGKTYKVTASFGVVKTTVSVATTVNALLDLSGKYLAEAQKAGGNKVIANEVAVPKRPVAEAAAPRVVQPTGEVVEELPEHDITVVSPALPDQSDEAFYAEPAADAETRAPEPASPTELPAGTPAPEPASPAELPAQVAARAATSTGLGLENALTLLVQGKGKKVVAELDSLMKSILPLLELYESLNRIGLNKLIDSIKTADDEDE